ncbi:hypothetical protein K474DRAFT_1606546, partial [Panus rudis PR-1116 ss-1]
IILVVFLMLMNAYNAQATLFQKFIGAWLFANSAANDIFAILGRIGLSVAYSTTLRFLEQLSVSARNVVRAAAHARNFLLIYDNINRMRRVWDPDIGQKDVMDSGTAAMLVVLQDCNPKEAFDWGSLEEAQVSGRRKELSLQTLRNRVDQERILGVMALHCLSFLAVEAQLHDVQEYVRLQFQSAHSVHRMRHGRKTEVHPLGTSDHDEGSAGGNRQVLDDLILGQLGLKKEELDEIITIVGGDQATVEKLRTLKPEISSFAFVNERLGRKVKNVKRPDFYPAQALVFDTLEAEVLDCWRLVLNANDLKTHFANNPIAVEDLLLKARVIVQKWMTTQSSETARFGSNEQEIFPAGSSVPQADPNSMPDSGDAVLANTILRMRDSMLHYEFQHAIAGGDIGRAMNVMNVRPHCCSINCICT